VVRSHARLPIPLRPVPSKNRNLRVFDTERRMFKFLGSTIGIIFLIGLVVVILLLKFIF